ncbi:hypothetical protein BH09BAC2_BH09BAC2_09510 [soil metagenome]
MKKILLVIITALGLLFYVDAQTSPGNSAYGHSHKKHPKKYYSNLNRHVYEIDNIGTRRYRKPILPIDRSRIVTPAKHGKKIK